MPAGRPSKLTKKTADRFCLYISQGVPIRSAAALCRTHERTVHGWLKRGREADPDNEGDLKYAEFSLAYEEAKAESERFLIEVVRNAAEGGSWQAAAFSLKHSPSTRSQWKQAPQETTLEIKQDDIDPKELEAIGGRLAQLVDKLK